MTKRSAAFHRGCQGPNPAGTSNTASESPTKTLLRLLTYGNSVGGLPRDQFRSLFSTCPRCLLFMTWDAARFHDCSDPFDKEENWGTSDFEEEEEEEDRMTSNFEEDEEF